MSDNTIIQQGTFVSTGLPQVIQLRSDIDWMQTWNMTTLAGTTQWDSVRHYWQRDMPFSEHVIDYRIDVDINAVPFAGHVIASTTGVAGYNAIANRLGFYPIDTSAGIITPNIVVTAGTNATAPVYSTANTLILAPGAVVRIQNTAHTNLNGLDFTVGAVVLDTTFALANAIATAPGVIAGAAGTWQYIAPDVATYNMLYPSKRVIANITAASPAVVTTLVDHGYTTGQVVRLKVPAVCGMTQMNDLAVTITVLTAGTFSVGIDATGFTAFNFPLPAIYPFTPAEVIPVGDVGVLDGANRNQGYIGIVLASDQTPRSGCPAGVVGDIIQWSAGKSFATGL